MCGICGKINLNNDIEESLIKRMCEVLKHRGPDDEGAYIGLRAGLGHRRLSIIDLSPAGHQPMSNEDEAVWIIMNGEIYNFLQLRKELEKKGHGFKSKSDTEVILHLYEDKGVDCIKDLRGMFAFAIWDEKKEKLLLARDRLGKKPLYYSFKNGNLTFASELNALLQDNSIGRDIDLASIDDFMNYQYIPAPFTIFKEIKKLPPAHFLIWEKGGIKIEQHWKLDYSQKLNLSEGEYCEKTLDLLRESTRLRLISDVPLGAFLSGGIDSSAVVAMMAQMSSRPVKTFSIGFTDKSFDETPYARVISKRFATDHKEFFVKPDALNILPKLIAHFGEPYGDSSAIPTYYLCKLTKENVTVALNGDAGDESFGGYERYVANKIMQYFMPSLSLVNKLFGKNIGRIRESTHKKDAVRRLKKFLSIAGFDKEHRYARLSSTFKEDERAEIYTDFMKQNVQAVLRENIILKAFKISGTGDLVDSMLFADLMTYMPGDLLPKVDITSMANSLEVRSPFLDHKFLEFSAKIPPVLKIRGITKKYILKKALKGILPESILKRKKMGFSMPMGSWFRGELKDYAREILLDPKAVKRNYFKKENIERILKEHSDGKMDNGAKIWSLLNLELWHRMFIDRESM